MTLFGSRHRFVSTIACALLASFLVINGCAGPGTVIPRSWPDEYRSPERILHRFRPGDTPALLAQKYLGNAGLAWMVEDANGATSFTANRFIVIPLKIPNRGGIERNGYQTVPILCYHRFAASCDSPLCMPAATFERQLRYLRDNGYRVIGPEALAAFLDYRQAIPKKAIMITIDDGYRSVYDVAYPLLKKYGYTATLFIYVNFVGVSGQAITWDQLRKLKRAGFSIGSHSIAHSDLSKMKADETEKDYLARLKQEIFRSKQVIDAKLDQNTMIFAYPFGRHNAVSVSMARQAGYKLAVTVDRGGNPFFTDPYLLKRDQILKRNVTVFTSRLKTFTHDSLR